jgi:hypothetical protein
MPVTDDAVHPVNLLSFIGLGLGIAAGDDNLCPGIGSNGLPNGLPGLHSGFAGDRTSIDNAKVCGVFVAGRHTSQICEPPGNGIRFILIDLASQSGDNKLDHWLLFFYL